ncbi:MAG TPA: ATP synthase subunit I [Rhodanobacteraceae bacterium]|nr:ATP synthase subunit I [Rhodanobacteraceae bacterium]
MQLAAAVIVGLLFLVQGSHSAIAAGCGGLVVTLGTALLALRVFAPPPGGGKATLGRFAVGMLLKWMIVLGGFYLILVRIQLPPLPTLVGAGVVMLTNVLALRFDN